MKHPMTIDYTEARRKLMRRVEKEFSQIIRSAVEEGKFGQFGLIVSMQGGKLRSLQKHEIETLK